MAQPKKGLTAQIALSLLKKAVEAEKRAATLKPEDKYYQRQIAKFQGVR